MVVGASNSRPGPHTHDPPASTRLFTHMHEDELMEPVPDVVERDMEQTAHGPRPDEYLNEPTSHGWHVSVDESSSYPSAHRHTPAASENDESHSHDDELEDPVPDVDMCESGQAVHEPRSDDDL